MAYGKAVLKQFCKSYGQDFAKVMGRQLYLIADFSGTKDDRVDTLRGLMNGRDKVFGAVPDN